MKIVLQSTAELVTFRSQGRSTPVRVWVGQTESGVPVRAFVASIQPQTHDPAAHAQFQRELEETEGAEQPLTIDLRFII